MVEARFGVHWLTFTVPGMASDSVLDALGGGVGRVESIGGFGQPLSRCHESGARVYFGSDRPDQPVCVNVPGEVCDDWSAEAIAWACDLKGICTRLDLAADLEPSDLARRRLVEMRRAWLRGQVETKMAPGSHRWLKDEGPEQGCTAYFGGKTSKLQLRAYDRRGPLRLEWQWRPDKLPGQMAARLLRHSGARVMWRSLAHATRFPMTWYRELLEGDCIELTQPKEEPCELGEFVEEFRKQWGPSLYALRLCGYTIDDLSVVPRSPMKGELAAKFLKWSGEAEQLGYDGSKLKQEVMCRLKHGSTTKGSADQSQS